MKDLPNKILGLSVPQEMHQLFKENRWPADRRIDTSIVARDCGERSLLSVDLALLPSVDEIVKATEGLLEIRSYHNVLLARDTESSIELPCLDGEKALCIGGGSDYGDDLWVILDYRPGSEMPCVVANEWSAENRCIWRLIAPSFKEFASAAGLLDGSWRRGRFSTSRYPAWYEDSKPWWKFW